MVILYNHSWWVMQFMEDFYDNHKALESRYEDMGESGPGTGSAGSTRICDSGKDDMGATTPKGDIQRLAG